MAQIEVKNVNFSYDKTTDVLKNVSFTANQGEYIAVLGHNGSGKSTFAKILNGLIIPDKGEVNVCGYNLFDKKNLFEIRKRVGVVFQNPDNQLVASIVEDDVAFGPENLGIKREEIGERIEYALSSVGMQDFRKKSPARLSGGQKQRIAIAGVLALKPEVLVLDESTSMLDPQGRKEVLGVTEKLNKEQKVTVISITHYMEEAVKADKIYVLSKGEIVAEGTPKEIFRDTETLASAGLLLPPVTLLAEKLKKAGLSVKGDILSYDELLEGICKLK